MLFVGVVLAFEADDGAEAIELAGGKKGVELVVVEAEIGFHFFPFLGGGGPAFLVVFPIFGGVEFGFDSGFLAGAGIGGEFFSAPVAFHHGDF